MDDLPSDPTPSLPATEYHLIVSPALQVTAEVAAARGDPDLFNDMPSMLALMTLVRALADCYLQQNAGEADAVQDAVEAAPTGACLMVLNRGEMEQTQINDCIWALKAATTQLAEAGVLGREQKLAREAWQLLVGGDRDSAVERLKGAAMGIVINIDQWEQARGEGDS